MANEDKSTRYHRLRRRVAVAGTAWTTLLLSGLMVTGASVALRSMAERAAGPSLAGVVAVYVAIVAAAYAAGHWPLAFYRDIVLDRRYGLSSERTARWLLDTCRSGALVACALVPAGLLVVVLVRLDAARWWMAAATIAVLAHVLLAWLAPRLLPRSHALAPLAGDALRGRLARLAERAGVPVVDVCEWRVGDRTRAARATIVGLGHGRRILVSDTMLAAHDDEEIEAVVAHELAHHVHGDLWMAVALRAGLTVLGVYVADLALTAWWAPFGLSGKGDVAALPLVALGGGAVSLALRPMSNALSRAQERRADRFALDSTRNSTALISALRRTAAANLAEARPSRLIELLFHTHPTAAARIAAARAWAADPGMGVRKGTHAPVARDDAHADRAAGDAPD